MVVASSGWVQNASLPVGQNNTNLSPNTASQNNNKMNAKGILICRDNSHPFQERTLSLEHPVKIGRSVARARAAPNNAIFDCKVLSRNHALLWYSAGKFYLQDTRSSNGTFVNNQRLSASSLESTPREVCSGDIVQFGVDVVESTKKVTHGCIVATLKLYLPDGKEAKASLSTSVSSPGGHITLEDLYKFNQVMQEASRREKALYTKLGYLQQLVENTKKAANQSWKALISEDRLLSWVETIESQLAVYSKNFTEDKIRNELVKLQEEKAQYQNAAKEALQKILQEKLEVTQKLVQLEGRLNETEDECQSLHSVAKYTQTELQELSIKYTETQKHLQETLMKLMESEEKAKDELLNAEQQKQDLLKRIEDQSRIEKNLKAKLRDSRLDSVNIYKQITALRNYMQTLQDMSLKAGLDENLSAKDQENPIEAINIILNKLNSIHIDNIDSDTDNFYTSKTEQDNQINLQDMDSNQLKSMNSEVPFSKDRLENSLIENDVFPEYIVPPPSRRTLTNGNINSETIDINIESDTNSELTDETSSITSDDISEKSVIENKKEEYVTETNKEPVLPQKMEVRFASNENGEQLETHYGPEEQAIKEEDDLPSADGQSLSSSTSVPEIIDTKLDEIDTVHLEKQPMPEEQDPQLESNEGEHLDGDYIKTLKPVCKNDVAQQGMHSKEYILQTLIRSLDSLKGEDNIEAQRVVKRELEELKEWFVHESNDIILDKLKDLYYRVKNEMQRVQEVNEELVMLKETYSTFVEEKAELSKKYITLKTQCGDLLNATYTVPIHYVVPIVVALVWMLLEKIF